MREIRRYSYFGLLTLLVAIPPLMAQDPLAPDALPVVTDISYTDGHGAQAAVDGSNPQNIYVQDDNPDGESHYVARFYVRTSSLQMGLESSGFNDSFDIFAARDLSPHQTQVFVRVVKIAAFNHPGKLGLRIFARLDNDNWAANYNSEIPLPLGWRAVEVDWKAATTPSANNGHLHVAVDGVDYPGLDNLDNDEKDIDYVLWGSIPRTIAETFGFINLDRFEARRAGPIGLVTAFTDVALDGYWPSIHAAYHWEAMRKCEGEHFCPDENVDRASMARIVLVSKEDPTYSPPPCTQKPFNDVPTSHPYCPWIQELATRGVTVGCGGGNYCPNDPVSREQMAVFLLKTLGGPGIPPPACTSPPFNDVPTSSPFCPWIQELANRGITVGCGNGNYCPDDPNLRKQMAVFSTATFSLPVPQAPTP